jgi:methylated-DNA-[protein]-cysteine S-methyltransferase
MRVSPHTMVHRTIDSPIGRLLLAGDEQGLRVLAFLPGDRAPALGEGWTADEDTLDATVTELREYFAGRLKTFATRVAPQGTAFQQTVWRELQRIPYGETISYAELARRVGNPKAVRAVGLANGANPISILIPCHRVIGSNGTLVGYGGGLSTKRALLALERGQRPLL